MLEGEEDDDDNDDEIRRLRARTTSARGEALQQHQKKKGQVLEGARRRRAGGAAKRGPGRTTWKVLEAGSPVPVTHDFAGSPPGLAPPFHVTFTPPAAGKLFYSPGETPVPCYI